MGIENTDSDSKYILMVIIMMVVLMFIVIVHAIV